MLVIAQGSKRPANGRVYLESFIPASKPSPTSVPVKLSGMMGEG